MSSRVRATPPSLDQAPGRVRLRTVLRERRVEFAAIGLTAVVAGVIALLLEPLPPLQHALVDEGWTRGCEFVVLNLGSWMVLGLLGVLPMNIGLSISGITAERRQIAMRREETTNDFAMTTLALAGKLERLVVVCEDLAVRENKLRARAEELERQHERGRDAHAAGPAPEADDAAA